MNHIISSARVFGSHAAGWPTGLADRRARLSYPYQGAQDYTCVVSTCRFILHVSWFSRDCKSMYALGSHFSILRQWSSRSRAYSTQALPLLRVAAGVLRTLWPTWHVATTLKPTTASCVVSCRIESYRIASHRTVPYRTVPYRVMSIRLYHVCTVVYIVSMSVSCLHLVYIVSASCPYHVCTAFASSSCYACIMY